MGTMNATRVDPIHHHNGTAARRIDFDIEKETP
jgi:hypothetical protein